MKPTAPISTFANDSAGHSESLAAEMQAQLADILDEYLGAIDNGQPVDVEQFVATYPQFAAPLRECLEALALLHDVEPLGTLHDDDISVADDQPKRQLGDYEIIREVGRGGMGVVYEAEQISLRRKVALKVLPFAAVLDDHQILRFENEARAAAQLHHPNIVPVHGVGSDRGVHFYAMQFIDGHSLRDAIEDVRERRVHEGNSRSPSNDTVKHIESIGAFSTSAPSSSRRKHAISLAKLGLEAAEALHSAHESGVIHRDIKPSNLMLDKRGKIWVTDFGLARCQSNASITNSGDVLGTLQYMSPEQSQGKTALIDQRTDVYSLGVTLYELLTLKRPFEGDCHANVIRHIELGQYNPVRSVSPSVPRDLENIIAKAMATSREDRYTTAQELAEDLRRFIDRQPIRAKRPNLLQRATKWVGRHRTATLAACAILSVSIVCLAITTFAVSRGQAKTVRRLEENRQAFEEFGMRTAEWLKGTPGTETVRRALLTEVLSSHQKLLEQIGDSPAMRADTALTMSKIAAIHQELGEQKLALKKYSEAERIWGSLIGGKSADPKHQSELARCQNKIGLILRETGDALAAERTIRKAIETQEGLCNIAPNNFHFAVDRSTSYCNLGLVALDSDDNVRAEANFMRACELLEQLDVHDSHSLEVVNARASAYGNLANLHANSDADRAIKWSEKALAQRRLVASSNNINAQRLVASECCDLATLYSRTGRIDDATKAFDEAASIQRRLVKSDGTVVAHRRDLAVTLNNLGKACINADQLAEACAPFEEALLIQETLCGDLPGDVSMLSRLGGIHNNLAMAYQKQHRLTLSEDHFRAALTCQQKAFDLAPNKREHREYFSRSLFNYGRLLRELKKPFQAAAVAQKRSTLWPEDAGQLHAAAKELTLAVRQMPSNNRHRREWVAKSYDILRKASDVGWKPSSAAELHAFANVLGKTVLSHVVADSAAGEER